MKRLIALLCIISLMAFCGCNQKEKNETVNNTMSSEFVYAEEIGVLPDSGDCSDKVNKALKEGKSIYFGSGKYEFSKSIELKNAQIIGVGSTYTELVATGDEPLIKADGCFVVKDLVASNQKTDGKEKPGERVLICLGTNGGVTEGSKIMCVGFGKCGTGVYEPENAKPSNGLLIDTVEFSKVSYAGVELLSSGRKDNRISNMYVGSIGETLNNCANVGVRIAGSEENLTVEQLNVEHFRAETSVEFSGVKNIDVSTIHIEGMDIGKKGNGYIECNNTSGNIGSIVVFWSRVSHENSSCLLLGDADKENSELFIGAIEMKGINDPASFHGEWSNRGIKNNGYKIVNRKQNSENEYLLTVENYIWFSYQDDREVLSRFPCDDDNVTFLKKGNILGYGPTESRPTERLCKNYSTYYDTSTEQLLVYNGKDWVEYKKENK